MNAISPEVERGLKGLAELRQSDWPKFHAILEAAQEHVGIEPGESWADYEVIQLDLVRSGMTEEQAGALMYVLAEDVSGVPVEKDCDNVERWFQENMTSWTGSPRRT